ncbi:MAG: hypothetical protein JWP38_1770 [Herbaspirillum sp.]|nr:hypothetical protein [Herbaspirillum sp.]
MNSDTFYRDFEDLHRGSRDLIKSRLSIYLPFVNPLLDIYPKANALDIGCGRGEWLELIGDSSFDASGVDLDNGMLADCIKRGLNARQANGIQVLRETPSASVALISAFHVIEHISFDDLRVVMTEALRVLKPGGLLILETPNSENLSVGTSTFYLDPSHSRPIPSPLLQFLAEHTGFQRQKIVRLQEADNLRSSQEATLFEVLSGVSPDYGIVAQKAGDADTFARFDPAFNADYGVTLSDLAQRYDTHIMQLHAQLEAKIVEMQTQLDTKLDELQAKIDHSYKKKLRRFMEHRLPALTLRLRAITARYDRNAVEPTGLPRRRGIYSRTRRAWQARGNTRQFAKHVIAHGVLFVNARPYLKILVKRVMCYFPATVQRIRAALAPPPGQHATEVTDLSPRAHDIYTLIKKINKTNGQ